MGSERWLIAGLGNPGSRYEGTRHNFGFEVVRQFAAANSGGSWKQERDASVCNASIKGGGPLKAAQLLVAMPQTFMNRSGEVLAPLARYYDISAEHVVVVHDEVDLALGVVRIKFGGGDGGHNGIKSISTHLACSDYVRVRCGVGRPSDARFEVADFVLGRFASAEREVADAMLEQAVRAIECIVAYGHTKAQNDFNRES